MIIKFEKNQKSLMSINDISLNATEKVSGAIGLTMLLLFIGVLVTYVGQVDLAIISAVVVALTFYDFWRNLFRNLP